MIHHLPRLADEVINLRRGKQFQQTYTMFLEKSTILDLGRTAIRSIKIDFDGIESPCVSDIEIHREAMKK